jgi:dTDP-glucose 4,6-dehydratase
VTKVVLLTGAPGFIGSHFVEAILKTTDWSIVGLDRIDGTSTLQRILTLDAYREHRDRFRFVWHDLRAPINPTVAADIGEIDVALHLAASTHVDRSITDPASFVLDNVLGTCHLLEWAREHPVTKFIQFGTDEAYGVAPDGVAFRELDPYRSRNPYAATKAGAAELAASYHNTYGVPVVMTACVNAIGERQSPEKYLPLLIRKILLGETIQIHSDVTKTRPARRIYIHARNIWNVIQFLIGAGQPGERYNIAGDREMDCLELAQQVGGLLDREVKYELTDVHSSRPGHDLAYRLDGGKLLAMGFSQPVTFEASLKRTVGWFRDNPKWLGL